MANSHASPAAGFPPAMLPRQSLRSRLFCRQNGVPHDVLMDAMASLLDSQCRSADQLLAEQRRALCGVLEYAAAHVPYYRDLFNHLGARPADFASQDALTRFPILRRDAITQAPRASFFSNEPPAGVRYGQSSGSSGRPVPSAHGLDSRVSSLAARARAMNWHGATLWDRQGLLVAQRMTSPRRVASRLLDSIVGRSRNATFSFEPHEAAAAARRFDRFRPTVVLGQPSFIHRLTHAAAEQGLDPRTWGTRLVVSNSEVLTDQVDRAIAGAFGCPVLNEYGCTEVGSMAHRCPAGTLHLNPEHAIVELVDDQERPVPPGIPGEVILTSLRSRAMPLIRYAVGDAAVWADAPCSCGLQPGLRGLDHVKGRTYAAWRDDAGRMIASNRWVGLAQEALARAGFWECQLVQLSPREIDLRVHPFAQPNQEVLRELRALLREPLAGEVDVKWTGRPVERNPGGKLAVILRPRD